MGEEEEEEEEEEGRGGGGRGGGSNGGGCKQSAPLAAGLSLVPCSGHPSVS